MLVLALDKKSPVFPASGAARIEELFRTMQRRRTRAGWLPCRERVVLLFFNVNTRGKIEQDLLALLPLAVRRTSP